MRLSGLAVITALLFSPFCVAQRSYGGGGSSNATSGRNSGSFGGYHGSYSGGSSSWGGSISRVGNAGSGASRNSLRSSDSQLARPTHEPGIAVAPRNGNTQIQQKRPAEKLTLLSLLRRPFKKAGPKLSPDKPGACASGKCKACPDGVFGKNGACMAAPPAQVCPALGTWDGSGCNLVAKFSVNTCSLPPDLALTAAKRSMEAAKRSMELACSQDPNGRDCSDKKFLYQGAVNVYQPHRDVYNRAYEKCRRSHVLMLP